MGPAVMLAFFYVIAIFIYSTRARKEKKSSKEGFFL
jgi:cbb3-type cytochrome oxidase subunit 3